MGYTPLNPMTRETGGDVQAVPRSTRLSTSGRQIALGAEVVREGAADSFRARWRRLGLVGREGVKRRQKRLVDAHDHLMTLPVVFGRPRDFVLARIDVVIH